MRTRLALLLALAMLGTASLPAAPAHAVPRQFFGTVAFVDPTPTELERLGRGKAGTLRILYIWSRVEPWEGARNWSYYDALIGKAATEGVTILPTIFGSPAFASTKPEFPPKPAARADFASFLNASAERYGPGGDFWAENPDIKPHPIRSWQLWNEPSSPSFWYRKPSAKQYLALLRISSRAIKRAQPKAEIVLGGLFTDPRVKNGIPLFPYLNRLYKLGAKRYFDTVAVHPYAKTPREALKTVSKVRSLLRRRDPKANLRVTEIGWSTSGSNSPFRVGPKRQALYLKQTFRGLAKSRKRLRLKGVIWFSFKDQPDARKWIFRTGMFNAKFKPKPSWRAFVKLTGGKF